jgi:hypothetical protein
MELKSRVTSSNEYSSFNIFSAFSLFTLKSFCCYQIFSYTRFYYYELIKNLKINNDDNSEKIVFKKLAFLLLSFGYYIVLIYTFFLCNFSDTLTSIFHIWQNLYSTDSNIRDFDSFNLFYCNRTDILNEESLTQKYSSIGHLCLWNFFDYSFEYYVAYFIIISEVYSGYESLYGRIHTFYSSISLIFENFVKVYYIVLVLFFYYSYFTIYRDFNALRKIKKDENEMSLTLTGIKNEYRAEDQTESYNNNRRQTNEVTWSDIFLGILKLIVEILT